MKSVKPSQAQTCGRCFGIGYDASGYACTCTAPASVAKVGRRIPKHPQPPRPERWRDHLKDLARAMLLVIAAMFISAVTVALMTR